MKKTAIFKRYNGYFGDHVVGVFSAAEYLADYDVRIFLGSYDEIAVSLHNIRYINSGSSVLFTIPVRTAPGYSIKINSASVGCDNGTAEEVIKFFHEDYSDVYIAKMIQHLIFDNKKKRATPGL